MSDDVITGQEHGCSVSLIAGETAEWAAGTAQFNSIRKSSLASGEKVMVQDQIAPFEPLAPGEYRLHLYLFSRYATELNEPEQELVQKFSIVP